MTELLLQTILMALTLSGLSAFLIMTGRKTGVLDWLQARTPTWLPWGCNFCLGFWLSILFSILGAGVFGVDETFPLILVPVLATTFNNVFLK